MYKNWCSVQRFIEEKNLMITYEKLIQFIILIDNWINTYKVKEMEGKS